MSTALSLLVGLVLLVGGAEWLVRGASALAIRLGLTPLVVGLTVVAFGTSAPELVVSTGAALDGRGAIAAGNVVGSNIANIGLILGLAALVRPMRVERQILRIDLPLLLVVTAALPFVLAGGLTRVESALLVVVLVAYVVAAIRIARRAASAAEAGATAVPRTPARLPAQIALIVLGLGMLVVGADFFVDGSIAAARALGVSERVIGLTVVAAGTSLPELATSVLAAVRGEGDLALGNVVGSNIFNALGILGLAGLARPLAEPGMTALDLTALCVFAVLLVPFAWTGLALSRREGTVLLLLYAAYLVLLVRA